jgi:putative proteasome-type protease
MTYCVAIRLAEALIFASDSRTNAGVDNVSTFRKMYWFEVAGDRAIVMLNSGNLATTQTVVSLLRKRVAQDPDHILNAPSMFDVAGLVGDTVAEVVHRYTSDTHSQSAGVDFTCSFLVGGQIRGEVPRLFLVYPQGNFIEATNETPFLQIGEGKYGKPVLDRVIRFDTSISEAIKCALVSFDSTMRSNLSVGMPIDLAVIQTDDFGQVRLTTLNEDDPYFTGIRRNWGDGLRRVFAGLPDADWLSRLTPS